MAKTKGKAGKRGNGEGSIFQLEDGSWMAQISLGFKPDGKRNRPTFRGASRKEVADQIGEAREKEKVRAAAAIQSRQPTDMPLKVALKNWLLTYKRISVSSRTFDWYMNMANVVITYLGDIPLMELNTDQVQKFINYAHGTLKRSKRTIASYRLVLDQCMQYYSRELNIHNPVGRTVLPRDPDKNRERVVDALTIPDRQAFLMAIKGHPVMNPIMSTFMFTGMRTGEVLGLPWSNVRFEQDTIIVDRAITLEVEYDEFGTKISRSTVVDSTKTYTSNRALKAPQVVMRALSEWRQTLEAQSAEVGRPLIPEVFPSRFWRMRT